MNTEVLVPLLIGAVVGGGVFQTWRAVRPSSLGAAVARLGAADGVAVGRVGRWRDAPVDWLSRRQPPSRQRDLAVAGRTAAAHATAELSTAMVGAGAAIGLGIVGPAAGFTVAPTVLAVLVLVGAGAGFVTPGISLKRTARRRRRDFLHALSAFVDLANVLLAGGAGIETALTAAADAGDGWAFEHLRGALLRARTTRRSVWACFGELGTDLGVDALGELGATVALAGRHGARIATSLATRAASLRGHLLARIEADAQAASERMGLPTVLMFVGFLVLLGYPAVQIILGAT